MQSGNTTPRRLVTLKEVEKRPGYEWATYSLVRRLVYERRIASLKVAGRVFVDLADLDRMVENGVRPALAS